MQGEIYYAEGKNANGEEETPHVMGANGKVHFLVFCQVCHFHLCKTIQVLKSPRQQQNVILIPPCPNCLDAARRGVPVEMVE